MTTVLKSAALLAGVLSMAGCATAPQTGTHGNSAGIGLAAGAVAGGLLGTALGDSSSAVRVALIGAALGGGIGYTLDRKHAALQKSLAGTPMDVQMTAGKNGTQALRVIAPSDVTFEPGSGDIKSGAYQGLATLAKSVSGQPCRVEITGHTDNLGSDDFNQNLSYERARSVAQFLYGNGVAPGNIAIRGAGHREPAVSNSTPEGRARNRRVEISITDI